MQRAQRIIASHRRHARQHPGRSCCRQNVRWPGRHVGRTSHLPPLRLGGTASYLGSTGTVKSWQATDPIPPFLSCQCLWPMPKPSPGGRQSRCTPWTLTTNPVACPIVDLTSSGTTTVGAACTDCIASPTARAPTKRSERVVRIFLFLPSSTLCTASSPARASSTHDSNTLNSPPLYRALTEARRRDW